MLCYATTIKLQSILMASPEYHVIASQLVSALSYAASYLCTLSIVSYNSWP